MHLTSILLPPPEEEGLSNSLEPSQHLRILDVGEPILFGRLSHFTSLAHSFPPKTDEHVYYLPGNFKHWSNDKARLFSISFSRPCRVYMLLSELSQEPKWCRQVFHKLRDPYGQQVMLGAKWKFTWGWRMIFTATGKMGQVKRQKMRVYKSITTYHPGEQLNIGGPGLADLLDVPFVLAFHAEDDHEDHHAFGDGLLANPHQAPSSSNLTKSKFIPKFPKKFYTDELLEFGAWQQQLIKSLQRNRSAEVRFLIESDLIRPTERSHLAQRSITFVPRRDPSEASKGSPISNESSLMFLVDIPTRNRNVELLALLVARARWVKDGMRST